MVSVGIHDVVGLTMTEPRELPAKRGVTFCVRTMRVETRDGVVEVHLYSDDVDGICFVPALES